MVFITQSIAKRKRKDDSRQASLFVDSVYDSAGHASIGDFDEADKLGGDPILSK